MKSERNRWVVWAVALAASIFGVLVSWHMTSEASTPAAQTQPASQGFFDSMCNAFEWADCRQAAASPWARFPFGSSGGVSTASLGLAFFFMMTCWFLFVGWVSPARAWIHLLPSIIAGFGVGMSIYLEYILWTKLSAPCFLCIMSHVATFLVFVCLLILWPREAAEAGFPLGASSGAGPRAEVPPVGVGLPASRGWPSTWTLSVMTVVTGLLVVVALLRGLPGGTLNSMMRQIGAKTPSATLEAMKAFYGARLQRYENDPDHAFLSWSKAPRLNISIEGRPGKGPRDAQHTVVIFSDFECPKCQEFEERFETEIAGILQDPQLGGVRLVFKHWPICEACNDYTVRDLHPTACAAAYAAEAAYVVGGDEGFWKMHDLLFERREEWLERKNFTALAGSIGLEPAAFEKAMNSEAVRNRVRADIQEGDRLGKELVGHGLKETEREYYKVNATPAVFVDGKRMTSPQFPSVWRKALMGQMSAPLAPGASASQPVSSPTATGSAPASQADPLARIAQLEAEVKKKDQGIDELNKYYRKSLDRYEKRWEHSYIAWQLNPPMDIITQGRPKQGSPNPRHTIVIFSDFECPTCKMYHDWFNKMFQRVAMVTGTQLVFKHSPICLECNPHAGRNLHPDACQAAYAAEAAYILGGDAMFWRMHDLLFEKQAEWKVSKDFASLARQLGLNEQNFLTTMQSPEVKARILADAENGENMGKDLVAKGTVTEDLRIFLKVDGTPSVYVDGKKLWNPQFIRAWYTILGYTPPRTASQPSGGVPGATQNP